MEGPRAARKGDHESLRALTDRVFRSGMIDQYPQLFNEENYPNLHVCADQGACVSHVGTTLRGAVLFGCPIRVGCLGGVSTLPEYRKQGLASACFDDALRKAQEEGADLMIVSGDRNLYRTRGCLHVGSDLGFRITPETVPASVEAAAANVTVEIMRDEELPLVMDCYRSEPVRFQRPPSDYHHALQCGWVMNRPSDFLVIRERGAFRGYVIAPRPESDGSGGLSEFAGDRHAVLAALPHILKRYSMTSLGFQVQRHDALMRSLCEQAGLEAHPRSTSGTVMVLNFPRLMQRMHPRIEELLGSSMASQLRFRQEGTDYEFSLGDETFHTDRDTTTRMLFGTVEGAPQALQDLLGALGDALRTVLPLPTLWYGINYV